MHLFNVLWIDLLYKQADLVERTIAEHNRQGLFARTIGSLPGRMATSVSAGNFRATSDPSRAGRFFRNAAALENSMTASVGRESWRWEGVMAPFVAFPTNGDASAESDTPVAAQGALTACLCRRREAGRSW
jgi:hypothetical protein